jgi:hypothetical protein
VLEAKNFPNTSHGNPFCWHCALPLEKGSEPDSPWFESPHTAPPLSSERLSGILNSISDMPAKSFNIRRKPRSTSSESPFTIRRKPRSPCVGIRNMPKIGWLLYAENRMAPLRRKMTAGSAFAKALRLQYGGSQFARRMSRMEHVAATDADRLIRQLIG